MELLVCRFTIGIHGPDPADFSLEGVIRISVILFLLHPAGGGLSGVLASRERSFFGWKKGGWKLDWVLGEGHGGSKDA